MAFHCLDMTLAVAETLNPNKPNITWHVLPVSKFIFGCPTSVPSRCRLRAYPIGLGLRDYDNKMDS